MSSAMIAQARRKNLYGSLHQSDLVDYMGSYPRSFDLIVSAATLIHFGDLDPVLSVAAKTLRPDGFFVFTLFSYDAVESQSYAIHPHSSLMEAGCFAHGTKYIAEAAGRTGFRVLDVNTGIHDESGIDEIEGLIVTLALNQHTSAE